MANTCRTEYLCGNDASAAVRRRECYGKNAEARPYFSTSCDRIECYILCIVESKPFAQDSNCARDEMIMDRAVSCVARVDQVSAVCASFGDVGKIGPVCMR